jgi:hypothetical protein
MRKYSFTLSDVLESLAMLSGSGDPDDMFDAKTSTIRLECSEKGPPRILIICDRPRKGPSKKSKP